MQYVDLEVVRYAAGMLAAAEEAGLDVGDVGSDRYHHALGYLVEEAALLGDDHTQPSREIRNLPATRSTSSPGGP